MAYPTLERFSGAKLAQSTGALVTGNIVIFLIMITIMLPAFLPQVVGILAKELV